MRKILTIILILLTSQAWAADHYYRADCDNSGDGTTLACAESPGGTGAWKTWQDNSCSVSFTPTRGDTYYFAGSDTVYDYVCIRQASGSGELTLKKVTSAQSGVSGYDASHASKQAIFGYGLQIRGVSNVTIDGVAPTTAAKTGHGIKIVRTNGNISTVLVGSGYTRSGLTFRGIEVTSNPATLENCYASKTCNMAFELKDVTTVSLQGIYAHHMFGCIISSGLNAATVDGMYCQYNDYTAANHSNGWNAHYTNNITIKNSIFEDIEGTGFISLLTGDMSNWNIYNSIFFNSTDNPENRVGTGHGIVTTNRFMNNVSGLKIYSNTISNINNGSTAHAWIRGGCSSGCEIRNNLWYCSGVNCKSAEHAYPQETVLHFAPNSSVHPPTAVRGMGTCDLDSHYGATVTCTNGSGTIGCNGTGCDKIDNGKEPTAGGCPTNSSDNLGAVALINTTGTFAAGDTCTDSEGGDWTITYAATPSNVSVSNNFYSDAVAHNNETDHYGDANDPFTDSASYDFSLADSSTPLDKGYTLGPPYNSDITGTARPQISSYDIGAYERTTSTGDVTAPTVTAFTIAETSTSLTVSVLTFTCTDAVGVTGYCVRPSADPENCSWSGTPQSSVTFTATGAQTARAYCKDAASNVSTASTDTVTITLPTYRLPFKVNP